MRSSAPLSPEPKPILRAPKARPLLGHAIPLLRNPLGFLAGLTDLHSGLVEIKVGPLAAVVVCNPELTQQVLRDDTAFDKGGPLFESVRSVAGDNLISCPHSTHRRQRRLVQPTFHQARFPRYVPIMISQIEKVVGRWHDGQTLDMLTQTNEIAANTITTTMFTEELPPETLHQVVVDVKTIVDAITKRLVIPAAFERVPTPGNRRYHQAQKNLRAVTDQIVAARRADDTDHGDLLSALLSARDPEADNDSGLSDDEIYYQLIAFFMAGSETTANAMGWALHSLALYPDIAERLHQEVDAVVQDRTARFEDLDRLPFAANIISETLRVYPPAWMLTRKVTADTRLGEYLVPDGTTLVYSPYLLHHRSDLHDNAEKFDPDRWDNTELTEGRDAFIPFGAGPRQCMGKHFGRIEATLALATIAARWHIHHAPTNKVRLAAEASLQPKGLRITVTAR